MTTPPDDPASRDALDRLDPDGPTRCSHTLEDPDLNCPVCALFTFDDDGWNADVAATQARHDLEEGDPS